MAPVCVTQNTKQKYKDRTEFPVIDEIRKHFIEQPGPFVFYTNMGKNSDNVWELSQRIGGKILRESFPPGYNSQGKCTKAQFRAFLGDLSEVFAERATGDVYLMALWDLEGSWQQANTVILNLNKFWFRRKIQTILCLDKVTSITIVNAADWHIAHLP